MKGGVWELDLSPIKIALVGSIFSKEYLGCFPFPLEALDVTTVGKGDAGTTFNSLSKYLWCCFNLLN